MKGDDPRKRAMNGRRVEAGTISLTLEEMFAAHEHDEFWDEISSAELWPTDP